MIAAIRRALAKRRLKASLHPDPSHRTRRMAQFTPERRARYAKNIAEMGG